MSIQKMRKICIRFERLVLVFQLKAFLSKFLSLSFPCGFREGYGLGVGLRFGLCSRINKDVDNFLGYTHENWPFTLECCLSMDFEQS